MIGMQREPIVISDVGMASKGEAAALRHRNSELERRCLAAEEASSRKTQLLVSLTHDIRSSVNSINLRAEAIRRTAENDALVAQLPGMIVRLHANTTSLVELLSAILDDCELATGCVSVRETVFSLNELLASSCAELLPIAEGKGLILEADLGEETLWLMTDRVKLDRVVRNLMLNAIKFTDSGGVTVAADLSSDAVLIRVTDTGVGMTARQLEVAFDRFTRFGRAGYDERGWGLGLSICRRLLNFMGGRIAVESRVDEGTTFTVGMPLSCVVDSSADLSVLARKGETSGSMVHGGVMS